MSGIGNWQVEVAYQVNVLLCPLQSLALVQQPDIQVTVLPNLVACQKSEYTNTIINLYKDDSHVGLLNDHCPVKILVFITSIPTALDEEPNGQLVARLGTFGCKNVEKKAILVCRIAQDGT